MPGPASCPLRCSAATKRTSKQRAASGLSPCSGVGTCSPSSISRPGGASTARGPVMDWSGAHRPDSRRHRRAKRSPGWWGRSSTTARAGPTGAPRPNLNDSAFAQITVRELGLVHPSEDRPKRLRNGRACGRVEAQRPQFCRERSFGVSGRAGETVLPKKSCTRSTRCGASGCRLRRAFANARLGATPPCSCTCSSTRDMSASRSGATRCGRWLFGTKRGFPLATWRLMWLLGGPAAKLISRSRRWPWKRRGKRRARRRSRRRTRRFASRARHSRGTARTS